jgi:uncharacterized protein (DUF488 family)
VTTLFTIGYEQHSSPAALIEELRAAGVHRLVDVRELPLSRRQGFSKTALGAALGRARIEYSHVRALGNPKQYRALYKAGKIREGEKRYRAHLHKGSYSAVIELSDSLKVSATCLLCFEEAHEECHRAVIVEALQERIGKLKVVHL